MNDELKTVPRSVFRVHSFPSVSRRRLAAQGRVNRYLVEGRNQNAFGFGVAGGEQVELRNLARQHAELEQLVPDRRRSRNFLRGLVERLDRPAQFAELRCRVAPNGQRVPGLNWLRLVFEQWVAKPLVGVDAASDVEEDRARRHLEAEFDAQRRRELRSDGPVGLRLVYGRDGLPHALYESAAVRESAVGFGGRRGGEDYVRGRQRHRSGQRQR